MPDTARNRFRQICDELEIDKKFRMPSLRKYEVSMPAQQVMPWQVMIEMFANGDCRLILDTYYVQNDDARPVGEASRNNFGLNTASDRGGGRIGTLELPSGHE